MTSDGVQGDEAVVDRTLERMGLTVDQEDRERLIRLLPRLVSIAERLRAVPLGDAEMALHFSTDESRAAGERSQE